MKEINLPPFYAGQKVVGIEPNNYNRPENGRIYTVLQIRKGCCNWEVDIGETPKHPYLINCVVCLKNKPHGGIMWFSSFRFAPIHENFQSVSFEKIIEKETHLISAS